MEELRTVNPMEDEVPFGVDVEQMEVQTMDDMDADGCLHKINNWERYRKFWLDYYQKRIDEVNQKCDKNIAYQHRKLRSFFESVPHRSTKTMEAYDLPSGKIQVTFGKPNLVPNKEAILERFRKEGETEFIKVKEELDWSGYKSRLFISETGDVLDQETGEIVEDVSIETPEPKFAVKINEKVSDEQ